MSDIEVVHVPERERYVIRVDGEDAGLTVAKEGEDGTLLFSHTEVKDEYEGQGLASRLVAGALDDVRSRGKKIEVTCEYVTSFLEKHPEYQDLVA
jgi:predicted GNAT family acetyltransferase